MKTLLGGLALCALLLSAPPLHADGTLYVGDNATNATDAEWSGRPKTEGEKHAEFMKWETIGAAIELLLK